MPRRWILLVALVVGTTACSWPMAGQGANRRGWNRDDTTITPTNVTTLANGWAATVTGGADETIGTSTLIVSRTPTQLRGLNPVSGGAAWTSALSSPVGALRADKLFAGVGGSDCTLRTFTAATGAAGPVAHFGGPVFAPATLAGCAVPASILNDDVRIIVPWFSVEIGTATGCASTKWAYTTGISAYTTDLAPLWTAATSETGCGTPPDFSTKPHYGAVTRSTNHFITTLGDQVVALPTTCTVALPCVPSWTRAITQPLGPVVGVSKTSLAIVNATGTVSALDEATGAVQWTGSVGASASVPLAATNAAIFAVGGTTLYSFRAGGCGTPTCTEKWRSTLGFAPAARASISGDVLYVGGGTSIAALNAAGCGPATCTPLVTRSVASTVTGSVVALNKRVYVPTVGALRTLQPTG